jgi:hypothetical protein
LTIFLNKKRISTLKDLIAHPFRVNFIHDYFK